MIKQYPHTVKLIRKAVIIGDDDGLNGAIPDENDTAIVRGRFEFKNESQIDYTAKFYSTQLNSVEFSFDGGTLEFEGRTFKIIKLSSLQTHTEIWLE